MIPYGLLPAALVVVLALAPIRRPFPLAVAGWVVGLVAVELPLHLGILVVAGTAPAVLDGEVSSSDLVAGGMAAAICAGLGVLLARQLAAARVLDTALAEAGVTTTRPAPSRRTPWLRVLLQPWPLRTRGLRRDRLHYGPDEKAHRLDLYTRRGTGPDSPVRGVLVHLHGGHFRGGGPSRESRALLFDHAQRGWAAVSATYHLATTPEGGFPRHLQDVKRLIAWIRSEGPAHGIPADAPIVVAGSSAGAHIASMAALTANDPRFQPGFEEVDTRLAGAIGLYGYYGRLGLETRDVSDPVRHPAQSAPPFFVVHGTHDAYTPLKGSRRLVRHLRGGSTNPVVYAELPGAQHGFDPFASPRFLAVVRATGAFTDTLAAPDR